MAAITVSMYKGIYLAIVFLLPIITVLIPIELFQNIWIWLYAPLGAAYGTYIWFQPDEHMMKFVTLTPFFFLVAVLLFFPGWVAVESGLTQGLQFLLLVAIVAIPSSIPVGLTFVLAAFGLYALFKKYGWLPNDS